MEYSFTAFTRSEPRTRSNRVIFCSGVLHNGHLELSPKCRKIHFLHRPPCKHGVINAADLRSSQTKHMESSGMRESSALGGCCVDAAVMLLVNFSMYFD